ncbi:restriction endonuclease subunit S [Bacillus toyonensis]|uniref:restriction endonuclease subunit S n=1 Tax=Bacillus toyonensis TaxID=155322 RepID=UPI000BFA9B52|nr:restriction endonuclease subunit S [Bacillus toyonensis]PFW89214.1 restriction endonuclease subunit S [Bacillus toyonensis]PGC01176.1 restriction endonuclease subunit S [Bacillus toyonensis]
MKNKRTPDIRFPGFTGYWEQCNLGNISTKIGSGKTPKGGNQNYKSEGIPLLRSQNIFNDKVNLNDVVYITPEIDEDMANSRVQKGDVLLNITGASIGRSAVYKLNHKANVNQHVSIIRPSDKVNPYFIQLNITSEKGQKQIELNQAGGGREGLNFQQIAKMGFYFPDLLEQDEIGEFFIQLDNTIALYQQELTILKQTKQGFLQKMFPKEGESVPEIRFPGYIGDWEQRKLGEISDVTKLAGFEFTKYVIYADEGKIIALRGLNVKNRKLVLDDVKYIDQSDFSKLNRSKLFKNDILFTYVGTVGELAVVPENDKYYLAPNVARIRLNDNVNPQFVSQMMGNKMFYDKVIFPLVATSSQPALSMENIRKFTLKLPSIEEQTKIGEFFKQLDDTINLHQRELDALKETKKALLQKMFA